MARNGRTLYEATDNDRWSGGFLGAKHFNLIQVLWKPILMFGTVFFSCDIVLQYKFFVTILYLAYDSQVSCDNSMDKKKMQIFFSFVCGLWYKSVYVVIRAAKKRDMFHICNVAWCLQEFFLALSKYCLPLRAPASQTP